MTSAGSSSELMPQDGPEGANFRELERVRLKRSVSSDGRVCPAGSLGTIVHRYHGGSAYEVEFVSPLQAVLTLNASEITSAQI